MSPVAASSKPVQPITVSTLPATMNIEPVQVSHDARHSNLVAVVLNRTRGL